MGERVNGGVLGGGGHNRRKLSGDIPQAAWTHRLEVSSATLGLTRHLQRSNSPTST